MRIVGVAIAVAMLLTACSGDDEAESSAKTSESSAGGTTQLTQEEFELTESEWTAEMAEAGFGQDTLLAWSVGMTKMCDDLLSSEQYTLRIATMEGEGYPGSIVGLGVRRFCPEQGKTAAEGADLYAQYSADSGALCATPVEELSDDYDKRSLWLAFCA